MNFPWQSWLVYGMEIRMENETIGIFFCGWNHFHDFFKNHGIVSPHKKTLPVIPLEIHPWNGRLGASLQVRQLAFTQPLMAFDGDMAMDQYLWIPFLGGWTSINPSYFDVNYRGTIGFDTLPYWWLWFFNLVELMEVGAAEKQHQINQWFWQNSAMFQAIDHHS